MFEKIEYISCGKFISRKQWKHQERIIDSYETIFVTKGTVFINENGIDYELKTGDFITLHPFIKHYGYKYGTNTEFFWFHWQCKDENLTFLNSKSQNTENKYVLTVYFRQLLKNRVENRPHEYLNYLTRLILFELYFECLQKSASALSENISAWIKANRHTPIKTSQIAEHFGYNAKYLNRMFKKHFSQSIKEYIDRERMDYIKTLMLTDNLSLCEIAAKSGFNEYKYFLKFFKYHEGITPTQFYRQNGKIYINTI